MITLLQSIDANKQSCKKDHDVLLIVCFFHKNEKFANQYRFILETSTASVDMQMK